MTELDILRSLIQAETTARQGEIATLSSRHTYLVQRFDHYTEIKETEASAQRKFVIQTMIATSAVFLTAFGLVVAIISRFG